jgi:hypothetical protein
MSSFSLGDQSVRAKRKGIWLKPRCNPDVTAAIRKSRLLRLSEQPWRIEIIDLLPKGMVVLEIWCCSLLDNVRGKQRHNVFRIMIPENPKWVCSGNLGRGLG